MTRYIASYDTESPRCLAACQRIVRGTQSLTVYKPIRLLATRAAEIAVAMAKEGAVEGVTTKLDNGKIEVPSILLSPIQVDKENIDETVIKDGFHDRKDVYGE